MKKIFAFGFIIFFIVSTLRYLPLILYTNIDTKEIFVNEYLYRTNCSVFLNDVYLTSKTKPFLLGKTFSNPFLSLQSMLGDETAKSKIANAETGSKQYILSNFLGVDQKDICSCAVVDTYANFYYFGIIILFLIYLFWFIFLFILLNLKILNTFHITLIYAIISSIILYETDGLSLIFDIIKSAPLLFLFLFLNPVKLYRIDEV